MMIHRNDLLATTRTIAANVHTGVQVEGLSSFDIDPSRTEMLISVVGCHAEPCILSIVLTRETTGWPARQLRERLVHAFATHLQS